MKLNVLVTGGILCLAVVTALALSMDSGRNTGKKAEESATQGGFYTGAAEKKPAGVTPVDLVNGGTFRLEPALQGDMVEHYFLIRNTYKTPVSFSSVKSCCGVILTGYTKEIAPGETGRISVVIPTDKFGGKTVKGRITAVTQDPAQPDLSIGISMDVNKLASLSQFKIVLSGSFHDVLEGSSFIVPEKNHPFTVKGVKARKGLHIVYTVKDEEKGGQKGYLVHVKNTLKKPGIYRDTLYVATDCPERPEIRVRVEGRITR